LAKLGKNESCIAVGRNALSVIPINAQQENLYRWQTVSAID